MLGNLTALSQFKIKVLHLDTSNLFPPCSLIILSAFSLEGTLINYMIKIKTNKKETNAQLNCSQKT